MNLMEFIINEELSLLFPKKNISIDGKKYFIITDNSLSSRQPKSLLALVDRKLENKNFSKALSQIKKTQDDPIINSIMGNINSKLKFEIMKAETEKNKNKRIKILVSALDNFFKKVSKELNRIDGPKEKENLNKLLNKIIENLSIVFINPSTYKTIENKLLSD